MKATKYDELLSAIRDLQAYTDLGFKRLAAEFNGRSDSLEKRFGGLEKRFDALETRVDSGFRRMDERFDSMDARLAAVERR